jgi:hypothetical protein
MAYEKYKSRMLPKIFKMASEGALDWQIAHALDVNIHTFSFWVKTKPEVVLTLEKARQPIIKIHEEALSKRALGFEYEEVKVEKRGIKECVTKTKKMMPPDVKALIFYLKNRDSKRWKDVQKVSIDTQGNVLGNIDASSLSDEKLALLREAVKTVLGADK